MRKALLVIDNPKAESLCSSILDRCVLILKKNGYKVLVHDLHDPIFNPVMGEHELCDFTPDDVLKEQIAIKESNLILTIHPVWWFSFPAVIKGWYDRVLKSGFAFDFTDEGKKGLLNNKKVVCFQTAGMPFSTKESSHNVSMTHLIWKYCGVKNVNVKVLLSNKNADVQSQLNSIDDYLSAIL